MISVGCMINMIIIAYVKISAILHQIKPTGL